MAVSSLTTFTWPAAISTAETTDDVANKVSVTLSAWTDVTLTVNLVGTELLEGTVEDSAVSWAENDANTQTSCTDEDNCQFWFDGYAVYVEYLDSKATTTVQDTDNVFFCL